MTITSSEIRFLAARSHIETGAAQIDTKTLLTIATHIDAQAAQIAEQQLVIDQRNGECDRLINELAALRDWVKCVEAERDKAIGWHSSLLRKYEQLIHPDPVAVPDEATRGDADVIDVGFLNGWNACRAEVLRLNSGSK